MTPRRIAALGGGTSVLLAGAAIAQAQDPVGVVERAWEVGGPIAATVAIMLLASGIAIRALWNELQAARGDLKAVLEQRTTDTVALAREVRDCINANTAALERIAERLDQDRRPR